MTIFEDDKIISVQKLKKDLRQAAETLSTQEARFLVDAYYTTQADRIRAQGRVRAMSESTEPHSVINWLEEQSSVLEKQILAALDRYSASHPIGEWMRSIAGVGPVIAAGFLANLNITRAPAISNFWSYCGVAPGRDRRVKGEKIKYNPSMKRLTFLLGESFKRLSKNNPDNYYRHVYDVRKAYEAKVNEEGGYAEIAKDALEKKKYRDDTKAKKVYESGKLPLGHLDRRAARYAAKFFLAHLHEVWFEYEYGKTKDKPYPLPYPIAHLGHAHVIPPPRPKVKAA